MVLGIHVDVHTDHSQAWYMEYGFKKFMGGKLDSIVSEGNKQQYTANITDTIYK